MAQRNIISQYDARTRRQIAVWLADGVGPGEVRRRLESAGISPLPHNTSFLAYKKSSEYRKIYERQLELAGDVAKAETDWRIAEQAGANGYAAAAIFEILRDLRKEYDAAEDTKEKVEIAATINGLSRTFAAAEGEKLREADRAWRRQFRDQEDAWKRKLSEAKEQWRREQAAKVEQIKNELAGTGRKTFTQADVADQMNKLLGL